MRKHKIIHVITPLQKLFSLLASASYLKKLIHVYVNLHMSILKLFTYINLIASTLSIRACTKVCTSKSVYLFNSSYSLKVYRFACAHFILLWFNLYIPKSLVSSLPVTPQWIRWLASLSFTI